MGTRDNLGYFLVLATNKPAEFLILRIAQDTRALEAELASAGL